ncbi:MAG: NAD-dependent malic enzyme [Candidatus Nanopelagicales bacterium]
MSQRAYEILPDHHGGRIKISVTGSTILRIPRLNRGTAFTLEERERFGLIGHLPTGVTPLEAQLHRSYHQFQRAETDLDKFAFLSALRDRNTVLFYRLLSEHLEEMMPIVYTPTIGAAIIDFSKSFQRLHGVFLSIDNPEQVQRSLEGQGRNPEDVDLIVVTDSEGILGIGDQGVGGIQIALGKKSLYTAAAGIDPNRMIAVGLDVGTDNLALLSDPLYLGLRHSRVRGQRYDDFIETFVTAAITVFPHAMIHWEDFGAANAHRLLATYRDRICTFNDDVQGTAAVVAAAALAAVRSQGARLREQRIVIHGAGTAGVGVADLLRDLMIAEGATPQEATAAFWGLGSRGLLTTALGERVRPFQRPYARTESDTATWTLDEAGHIGLADVVRNVRPTILIGTSGQPGAFTESIVREMAAHMEHPVIMPLSNPTSLVEATPEDLLNWTDGRALIATGSPFAPVRRADQEYRIAQANNALVFPGLGLGVAVCRATRVTDSMIAAAAEAVAGLVRADHPGASLLPQVSELRMVSATVAMAVADAAKRDGVATRVLDDPVQQVFEAMWTPVYPELVLTE